MKSTSFFRLLLLVLLSQGGHFTSAWGQEALESSLLWKIESPQNAKPSFLFGTIHLICPADFSVSDSLKACIKQSEQLTLELDMDEPNLMMSMAQNMIMRDGVQLKELVSSQEYERMERFFKDSVGLNIAMFGQAKPFVLVSVLLNRVLACQPQSYELSLMNLAKQQQIEVLGLETVQEQMSVFDSIPYPKQAAMLLTLLDSLPKARQEFAEMVSVYKQQDVEKLHEMTFESEFELKDHQETLLYGRNRRWIPLIEKQIADKPTFIAVGAAHLGGKEGLLELLRAKGYLVTPIQNRSAR
ncbi:TraB/GumN family protein [Arundinibacter roseus]|uniref:TraB/GumN family protein n=1 Tax=Arundinibacter roseus TaxID=2070510 RepID=A0A4R4KQ99_9BACT|nr:TraB/GumN family protein [Arundinibacter roseus]TDB69136.1 TraB/GumN family protein [Arundinibacter roseus]